MDFGSKRPAAVRSAASRVKQGVAVLGDDAPVFTPQFALLALRRSWKLVVPCALLLATAGAVAVYFTYPPAYSASALLRVSDNTPYIAFQTREDSRRFLETQMELLRSPLVLGPVVSRPDIAQLPAIRSHDAPIAWLGSRIKASSVGHSELVKISFDASNATDAAQVVNAVVENYLDFRGRDESEQVRRVLELLEEEKTRRMREVDAMRDSLRDLTKQITGKDLLGKGGKEPTINQPLVDLNAKLVGLEVERQVLEAQSQAYEESIDKKPFEVPDTALGRAVDEHPRMQSLKNELTLKEARLQEYEHVLVKGKEDPLHRSLTEEIAADKKQIEKVNEELKETLHSDIAERLKTDRKDGLAKLQNVLDNTRLMERLLKERVANMQKDAKEVSGDTLQLEFKRAELTQAEQVLSLIAERAIRLRTEQRAPTRVALMMKADEQNAVVEWKSFYKKLMAAAILGLCFPIPLAVGWEWFARRISNTDQVEVSSRLPVLGEIARLPMRSATGSKTLSHRAARELRLFEESIDSLRTCLTLSESLRDMQVLAITSASNGEGKTSISLQLAISLARASGEKVLLVDADMRSPDIHRLLQIRGEPGMAETLGRKCRLAEAIVTDWSQSVHILPAGSLDVSPHHLLGNGEFKSIMDEAKQQYRYVVVDTPPVLPAAESLVLARAADACLVCVMRDVSRMDRVRHCCNRLAAAGVKTVGVVLNGVPSREYARHFGKYYGTVRDDAALV